MILALFLFVAFSCVAGVVGGILYSKKASEAFTWNEHIVFVIEFLILGAAFKFKPDDLTGWDENITILCWWFAHSFFHDAFYYETRNRIDVKEYHWYYDYSPDSTARLELRFLARATLLSFSLLIFVTYCLFIR